MRDTVRAASVDAVRLRGLLGRRLSLLVENRLLPHEEDYLLWPFREHCKAVEWAGPPSHWGDWRWLYPDGEPPSHPEQAIGDWHGEFIGTWVAAAIVAAVNAGDQALRAKVDRVVSDWLATQGPDGYLGTYDAPDRWKSWDVWIQAHALLGLLTYHEYTADEAALVGAVGVADCLLEDFGPGRRSLTLGPHAGLASSAILEPLVWLYWRTGDERYLAFARWLVDVDWEAPNGPAIISLLQTGAGVAGVANGKAAEMLIDLAGMVELYRATGDDRYLGAVLTAWEDIVRHHLYITGSASAHEVFNSKFELANDGSLRIGETCVTMCWIYLSSSLGRLTGEARFFDAVEQALYNHLLGAQSPDGRGWAYYVGLRDAKRYSWHTDSDCCPSRGTRALSLTPLAAFGVDQEGVILNIWEAAAVDLRLQTGEQVSLAVETSYPLEGTVRVEVRPEKPRSFALRIRVPAWCEDWSVRVGAEAIDVGLDERGYAVLRREWRAGEIVEIEFAMPVRVVGDALGNRGRVALARGPLVYAVDASYLPEGHLLDDVTLMINKRNPADGIDVVKDNGSVHLIATRVWTQSDGSPMWGPGRYRYLDDSGDIENGSVRLVPFFEAGNQDPDCYFDGVWSNFDGTRWLWRQQAPTYQVWNPFVSH